MDKYSLVPVERVEHAILVLRGRRHVERDVQSSTFARGKLAPPIEKLEDVGRLLAEIQRIGLETNRPGLFPFFAFLLYMGARKGEAIGLRLSDINLSARMVKSTCSIQFAVA